MAGLPVLAHMHTPPADSFTSRGQENGGSPFFHSGLSSWGDSRSLFSSRTGWDSLLFSSRSKLKEWPQGHDFCCVCIFLTDLWFCVYVFCLSRLRVESPFQLGLCISCCLNVEIKDVVFPTILWIDVGSFAFWVAVDYYESFGHDRAKNDSGIKFPN